MGSEILYIIAMILWMFSLQLFPNLFWLKWVGLILVAPVMILLVIALFIVLSTRYAPMIDQLKWKHTSVEGRYQALKQLIKKNR